MIPIAVIVFGSIAAVALLWYDIGYRKGHAAGTAERDEQKEQEDER